MMGKKILVLGGNGFIGSHLLDALLLKNCEVSVLDLSRDKIRGELPSVTYYYGSIEETTLLKQALQGQDVVVHLVSTTVPSSSNKNKLFDIRTNLVATVNILEIMKELGMKRIIYLSSGGTIYGNTSVYPIPESHRLQPITSYGIVKLAVEKYLWMYQQIYGFQPTILRPSNIYGPRQNMDKPQGVTGHFIKNILLGKNLSVWGDGSIRRDYLYVQDLVEALILIIETSAKGIFNIGSGQDDSINDIVLFLKKISDTPFHIQYENARQYDVQKVRLDIAKISRVLNWKPKVSLEQGISEQFDWMKQQLLTKPPKTK